MSGRRKKAQEAPAGPAPGRVSSARRPGPIERMARGVSRFSGSTPAFVIAGGLVLLWAATGPLFGYSESWQMMINTGTTIVTFLMVFVIQRAQNKESLAVQLKLNELVAAMEGASNRLINVEAVGEEELDALHKHYAMLVQLAQKEGNLLQSHSVDEASARHDLKIRAHRRVG